MIANQAETAPAYRPTRAPCTRRAVRNMTTAMIVSLEPGIGRPDPRLTIMKHGPRVCRRPPAVSPPDPGSRPPHGGAPTWVLAASNFLVDGVAVRKPAYRLIDGATVDVLPPLAGGQPTLSMIMSVDSGHIPKPTLTILKQPPAARRPPRRCWRLSPVSVEPCAERRCSWLEPRKGGAELVEGHPVTGQGQVAWCVRRIETAREQA